MMKIIDRIKLNPKLSLLVALVILLALFAPKKQEELLVKSDNVPLKNHNEIISKPVEWYEVKPKQLKNIFDTEPWFEYLTDTPKSETMLENPSISLPEMIKKKDLEQKIKLIQKPKIVNIPEVLVMPTIVKKHESLGGSLGNQSNMDLKETRKDIDLQTLEKNSNQDLPLTYVGKYIEDGEKIIFLSHKDTDLIAKIGETILGRYKIVSSNDSIIEIIDLNSNIKHTLSTQIYSD